MPGIRHRLTHDYFGIDRILKLVPTIADLAGSERIGTVHLAEAIQHGPRRPL